MNDQLPPQSPPVNLNPHYRGRVRSGCLTCRQKKVKCDEGRPVCTRCIRLNRTCTYPPKSVRHGASINGKADEKGQDRGHNTDLVPASGAHDSAQIEEASPISVFSPISDLPLPAINHVAHIQANLTTEYTAVSLMTSQDIYLCTTIDWLAARERLQTISFSYFLDQVDVPLLTPFDPLAWHQMKAEAVRLALEHKSMAAVILAVQWLWQAQSHSLPTKNALAQYEVATKLLEADLCEDGHGFSTMFLTAFLLALFSVVLMDDTDSMFAQHEGIFVDSLEIWSQSGSQTLMTTRIAAWLKILHAAGRRGGNQGILSTRVNDLLTGLHRELLSLSNQVADTNESASTSVFRFYLSLQCLSLQVANLSHYHRSRTTAADQDEVVGLMTKLRADLRSLWRERPAAMDFDIRAIEGGFPAATAEVLVGQIAVSTASYHAEHVDIDRSLGDPLSLTIDAREGLEQIESLVRGSSEFDGKLDPGYLRPLFMYAIEHASPTNAKWAIDRIKRINNPISRSAFFASYATGLAEEQLIKKRRVTTRWFCYERYGVRPPFL